MALSFSPPHNTTCSTRSVVVGATTFEIPLETNTYGLDEFEVAVKKYLSDHASHCEILERYPPPFIFASIQWKPASEVE